MRFHREKLGFDGALVPFVSRNAGTPGAASGRAQGPTRRVIIGGRQLQNELQVTIPDPTASIRAPCVTSGLSYDS